MAKNTEPLNNAKASRPFGFFMGVLLGALAGLCFLLATAYLFDGE